MLLLNKISKSELLGVTRIFLPKTFVRGSIKANGFTLMEVFVALAILLLSASSVGYFYKAFLNMEASEQVSARQILVCVKFMERAVTEPLVCADTAYMVLDSFDINLSAESRKLPGVKKMMQLNVACKVDTNVRKGIRPASFGRIVFCR